MLITPHFIEAALALNAAFIFVNKSDGYNASLLAFIFRLQDDLNAALSSYEKKLDIDSTQVEENIETRKRKEEIEKKYLYFTNTEAFPN